MLNVSAPNTVYSCTYGQACFDVVVKGLVGPDYVLPMDKIEYLLCLIETAAQNSNTMLSLEYISHIVIFDDDGFGATFENRVIVDLPTLEKYLLDNKIISLCKLVRNATNN